MKRAELTQREEVQLGFSFVTWLERVQDRPRMGAYPYETRILPFEYWRPFNRAVTIVEWEPVGLELYRG